MSAEVLFLQLLLLFWPLPGPFSINLLSLCKPENLALAQQIFQGESWHHLNDPPQYIPLALASPKRWEFFPGEKLLANKHPVKNILILWPYIRKTMWKVPNSEIEWGYWETALWIFHGTKRMDQLDDNSDQQMTTVFALDISAPCKHTISCMLACTCYAGHTSQAYCPNIAESLGRWKASIPELSIMHDYKDNPMHV